MKYLQEQLPSFYFAGHDFDEVGVPLAADQAWRMATTQHWIAQAQHYAMRNKVTVACGVTVPSEVVKTLQNTNLQSFFAFLKIDDVTIEQRLQARGWKERLIQDNINWGHILESEVRATKHHLIAATTHDNQMQHVANQIVEWINKLKN